LKKKKIKLFYNTVKLTKTKKIFGRTSEPMPKSLQS
jgi:hypothetical protein